MLLGNGHISFVDSGMILFANKSELLGLWNPNNLGYIYSLFASAVFFSRLISSTLIVVLPSIKLMQMLFYCGAALAIYYCTYFVFYKIQKSIFASSNLFYPAIAALFYSYNIAIILAAGVIDDTFHIIMIAPILFYFLVNHLQNKFEIKAVLIHALLIGLVTNSPPFSLAYLVTMYIPFFFLKKNLLRRDFFMKYLLLITMSLLVGSFFIFNLTYAYLNIVRGVFFSPPTSTIDFIFLERGVRGIFQFLFDWSISLYYSPTEPHPYYQFHFGPLGVFSTFFIWLFSLLGVIVNWETIKDKRTLLLIIFSLFLAMFLIKGDQAPFGNINLLLYKINPIMGIFRTPGSKFGLPIMLYLSLLTLFALNVNKHRIISVPLIIAVLVHTTMFFSPQRYIGLETSRTQKFLTVIPEEYKRMSEILNKSEKEGSVFLYPGVNNGYFRVGDIKFLSQDLLGKMISRPLIYSDDTAMKLSKNVITQLSTTFNPSVAGDASIRYVLIRADYDNARYKQDYKEKDTIISRNNAYTQIYHSDYLSLYELKSEYYRNRITVEDISSKDGLYYKEVSPYQYKIRTTLDKIDNKVIVLRNSFHSDWKLEGLDESKFRVRHDVYNNFANSWTINIVEDAPVSKNEVIELNIYYTPQKWAYLFGGISIFTSFGILFYVMKSK